MRKAVYPLEIFFLLLLCRPTVSCSLKSNSPNEGKINIWILIHYKICYWNKFQDKGRNTRTYIVKGEPVSSTWWNPKSTAPETSSKWYKRMTIRPVKEYPFSRIQTRIREYKQTQNNNHNSNNIDWMNHSHILGFLGNTGYFFQFIVLLWKSFMVSSNVNLFHSVVLYIWAFEGYKL